MPKFVPPPRPAEIGEGQPIAVFLDLDGTLIDLAPRPDDVVVPPELPTFLRDVSARLDGALAIVSGRSVCAVDALLTPYRGAAAGLHGAELRALPNGTVIGTTRATRPQQVVAGLDMPALRTQAFLIEDKGACVAIHHRLADDGLRELREAIEFALAAHAPDLALLEGRNVLEIKPRSVDKGEACRHLLSTAAFAGRIPVFLGDDLTDVDAFGFVREAGGLAIAVGDRVAAHAPCHLAGPRDVRRWLSDLLG